MSFIPFFSLSSIDNRGLLIGWNTLVAFDPTGNVKYVPFVTGLPSLEDDELRIKIKWIK